jgi:uncharacterized membrane protein YgcG
MAPRLSLVASLVALAFAGSAGARTGPVPVKQPTAPQGLKAFLLRADEPAGHVFSRTPSFAWHPVHGAVRYEFELATSGRFTDNAVLWSSTDLTSPVASIPIALPWITGSPYSLYAHVRALTRRGATPWSAPYGFNMRWAGMPTPLPSYPGLVRWTPVAGATQYNVWFVDVGKVFTTMTNVADEREYYSFHNAASWTGVVHWRVRPERYLYGSTTNGLPAVSFGPWSPVYTSYNPPFALGPLTAVAAVSDTTSDALAPKPHRLMPGFSFSGNVGVGGTSSMFRVYIATDRDCLNIVYRGAIVGSPAYAPRPTGPLALPHDHKGVTDALAGYLKDGDEGTSYMSDGFSFASTESTTSGSGSGGSGGGGGGGTSAPPAQTVTGAKVDLWDTDWPEGRYYWTVVPVAVNDPGTGPVTYVDTELPQEGCHASRELTFGKVSEPAVTAEQGAYASGLSPRGQLFAANKKSSRFYGAPLVAWKPALGAYQYELQWGHKQYPFEPLGGLKTPTSSTSAVLPLGPGVWYYRVRGINAFIPGDKPLMSWSAPTKLVVTRPTFRVVR